MSRGMEHWHPDPEFFFKPGGGPILDIGPYYLAALVNLLGITHVERNGHHYVNGMAAQGRQEQLAFLAAHPDVYEDTQGAVRLAIRDGRIALGSLAGPGFASGAMPDFSRMTAIW